jgi:hypothetical protein
LLKRIACKYNNKKEIMLKMIGNPENVPVAHIIKELYKGPSELCNCGITGYKNKGSLSTMPYSNSKKLLEGLLALKMPVTLNLN